VKKDEEDGDVARMLRIKISPSVRLENPKSNDHLEELHAGG
jgi:hypothetical protein